ncbi:hypothetical protein GJAV_G00032690 [Gymnothorax javanicus]|nr:hypothetical protein GJAV_G00032690 [Gymnothorax javanicus]
MRSSVLTLSWNPMAGTLHLTDASSSWLQPSFSLLKAHSVMDFSNPVQSTSFMWTEPIPGQKSKDIQLLRIEENSGRSMENSTSSHA